MPEKSKKWNDFSLSLFHFCYGIVFVSLLINSCASTSSSVSRTETGSGMRDVQGQIPTEYNKIEASESERPQWIDSTPDDESGLHFLVGLSLHQASERGAREDAMRHAREEYAKYTGVDLAVVDEVIKAMYGQSSDVFDPTIAQKSKSVETTDAQVSRIKAKQWYWEKYRAIQKDEYRGTAYKYWVLVTIPVDEYERVQAWKRKREQAQIAAEEKKANQAQAEVENNKSRATASIIQAREEAAVGNIVKALNTTQLGWNTIYAEIKRFQESDNYHTALVGQLEQLQRNIVSEIGSTLSALYIDTGRFGAQTIFPGNSVSIIKVWVWSRSGKMPTQVKGLPLQMTDGSGKIVGSAVTGPTGRADFHVSGVQAGQYKVTIDANAGTLSLLDRVIVDAISRVENRVTLINSQKDMQGATGDAVKALFGGPALAALDEQKLLMGPVTYADSRQGSSFGLQLQQVIRQNLTKIEGLIVVEPIKRNTAVVEQAIKTRGIGMNEKTPALGTPAMQAMIDGAQVALEVTYTVQGMEVWVEMFLKEAGTDILKGASSAIIDRNTIPVTLELIPDLADTLPPSVDSASAVKLVVTSHLGDGQTYQEGDTISYFVSSNRDAFVLLIYEDAEHNLIQILPNKYSGNGFFKAGNYMEVPAASDPFEFLIQGPFGIEKLWAFALTKPLPKLSGMELENGLTLLSDKMDVILGLLRAYGNQSGVSYGEAKTIVTTVPRR